MIDPNGSRHFNEYGNIHTTLMAIDSFSPLAHHKCHLKFAASLLIFIGCLSLVYALFTCNLVLIVLVTSPKRYFTSLLCLFTVSYLFILTTNTMLAH